MCGLLCGALSLALLMLRGALCCRLLLLRLVLSLTGLLLLLVLLTLFGTSGFLRCLPLVPPFLILLAILPALTAATSALRAREIGRADY
ncbi:MAG TPA: hypothetical protein VGW36_01375 [Pyrinomonadaceae bacterium]|nr:hypothetical protein [Pyrinomonadaceae bacterium]